MIFPRPTVSLCLSSGGRKSGQRLLVLKLRRSRQTSGTQQGNPPDGPLRVSRLLPELTIREVAIWFERKYGGYTKVLEHCWNSDAYRSAGSEVLCHITYGHARREAWVNVTLFPIRSTRFSFQPVLVIDLLSPAEKRMTGTQ